MTVTTTTPFDGLRDRLQASMRAGVDDHLDRAHWNEDRIAARQRDGLRALLAHAIDRSPFHRQRLRGIDPSTFALGDLAHLPVMTKADMMDHLDDVLTDRRLTVAMIERALSSTSTSPVPMLDEYFALASGGSSGRRGTFVLDVPAAAEFFGVLQRGLIAKLQALGGPPPGGLPIAQVAAASAVHATGCGRALTATGDMPFRFTLLPVTLPVGEIVARLNAMQPPALYGYASMLTRLAAEQRAGRLHISPLAVTTTSETLLPEYRAAIKDAFGVPIVDTFGSTEGLVGSTAPDDDVLVFNSDVCIVELVDDDDRPVPPGTPSAKVLVTNLANRVQPLVRYEMNDSFVRVDSEGAPDGHLRARVRGRADDILRYADADVHPLVVRAVLLKYAEIADYQVRQTRRGIDVDAVAPATLPVDEVRRALVKALADAGLARPEASVRAVPELRLHGETGKLRRFVPLDARRLPSRG